MIEIHISKLYDFTQLAIPVEVIRGKEDGPTLLVSAAIHGDELNGVDIIRRVIRHDLMHKIKGTLIAVPIVNVFGFNNLSRYLPDRRDLNRCFPGSSTGSLAARMAHVFMNKIAVHATHGIDLHTGAISRENFPQVRYRTDDQVASSMAHAFGAPVILNSGLIEGSMRKACQDLGIPVLLYEAGEALRFDMVAIDTGVRGVLSVMESLDMLPKGSVKGNDVPSTYYAHASHWLRAPHSGIHTPHVVLGDTVFKDNVLGTISDPFNVESYEIVAKSDGVVIGMTHIPLLNRGDAAFHIACFEKIDDIDFSFESPDLYV